MSVDRWLLVAALAAETGPVIRRLSRPRPQGARLVQGHLAGVEVGVLLVGVGPDKAYRRTVAAIKQWRADRVVSFGTCGALVDDLTVGDVVSATSLALEGERLATLDPAPGVRPVALTTVSEAVWGRERRDMLAALGAEVVEMEAASVWRAAAGRPFMALKVVSDQAGAEVDPVIGDSRFPNPVRVARFKARALKLVEKHLAGALKDLVSS